MEYIQDYIVINAMMTKRNILTEKTDTTMKHTVVKNWKRIIKMKMEDYYTKEKELNK